MIDYSAYTISQLAAHVVQNLTLKGLDIVVVGGLAVEFYTRNRYTTTDIDMIDRSYSTELLNSSMNELGFEKKGKNFVNPTTRFFIEFPSAPLEVGGRLIERVTEISTPHGKVPILKLNDIIEDRLVSYLHWGDVPCLYQALCMMLTHDVSVDEFEDFFLRESDKKTFDLFASRYQITSQLESIDIDSIESALLESILAEKTGSI